MKNEHVNILRVSSPLARQRGASLLEGIAYLGIAALVILGAVSLLANAFGNAQANRSTEEVISLRTAIRKLYSGQNYPNDGSIVGTIITARAQPGTLTVNGNAITNSWGGAVTVQGAANGATFDLTYANVPRDVCVNMLSGISGWISVSGNGGNPVLNNVPIPAATASNNICTQANNTVVLTAA